MPRITTTAKPPRAPLSTQSSPGAHGVRHTAPGSQTSHTTAYTPASVRSLAGVTKPSSSKINLTPSTSSPRKRLPLAAKSSNIQPPARDASQISPELAKPSPAYQLSMSGAPSPREHLQTPKSGIRPNFAASAAKAGNYPLPVVGQSVIPPPPPLTASKASPSLAVGVRKLPPQSAAVACGAGIAPPPAKRPRLNPPTAGVASSLPRRVVPPPPPQHPPPPLTPSSRGIGSVAPAPAGALGHPISPSPVASHSSSSQPMTRQSAPRRTNFGRGYNMPAGDPRSSASSSSSASSPWLRGRRPLSTSSMDEHKKPDASPRPAKKNTSRQEKSLGFITLKFKQILKESPNDEFDLNDLVGQLGTHKRRLYDIIAVLEAVRYLDRATKNKIRCASFPRSALGAVPPRLRYDVRKSLRATASSSSSSSSASSSFSSAAKRGVGIGAGAGPLTPLPFPANYPPSGTNAAASAGVPGTSPGPPSSGIQLNKSVPLPPAPGANTLAANSHPPLPPPAGLQHPATSTAMPQTSGATAEADGLRAESERLRHLEARCDAAIALMRGKLRAIRSDQRQARMVFMTPEDMRNLYPKRMSVVVHPERKKCVDSSGKKVACPPVTKRLFAEVTPETLLATDGPVAILNIKTRRNIDPLLTGRLKVSAVDAKVAPDESEPEEEEEDEVDAEKQPVHDDTPPSYAPTEDRAPSGTPTSVTRRGDRVPSDAPTLLDGGSCRSSSLSASRSPTVSKKRVRESSASQRARDTESVNKRQRREQAASEKSSQGNRADSAPSKADEVAPVKAGKLEVQDEDVEMDEDAQAPPSGGNRTPVMSYDLDESDTEPESGGNGAELDTVADANPLLTEKSIFEGGTAACFQGVSFGDGAALGVSGGSPLPKVQMSPENQRLGLASVGLSPSKFSDRNFFRADSSFDARFTNSDASEFLALSQPFSGVGRDADAFGASAGAGSSSMTDDDDLLNDDFVMSFKNLSDASLLSDPPLSFTTTEGSSLLDSVVAADGSASAAARDSDHRTPFGILSSSSSFVLKVAERSRTMTSGLSRGNSFLLTPGQSFTINRPDSPTISRQLSPNSSPPLSPSLMSSSASSLVARRKSRAATPSSTALVSSSSSSTNAAASTRNSSNAAAAERASPRGDADSQRYLAREFAKEQRTAVELQLVRADSELTPSQKDAGKGVGVLTESALEKL